MTKSSCLWLRNDSKWGNRNEAFSSFFFFFSITLFSVVPADLSVPDPPKVMMVSLFASQLPTLLLIFISFFSFLFQGPWFFTDRKEARAQTLHIGWRRSGTHVLMLNSLWF